MLQSPQAMTRGSGAMKHLHPMTLPAKALTRREQGPFLDVVEQLMQLLLAVGKLVLSGKDDKNFAF